MAGISQTPIGLDPKYRYSVNNVSAPDIDFQLSDLRQNNQAGLNLDNSLNAIGGAASLIGGVANELSGKSFKDIASNYESNIGQQTASSLNLMKGLNTNNSFMSNYGRFGNFRATQIAKKSAGQAIGQNLMSSAKGASTGLSVGGPWGALVGGVVGGVADLIGQIGGNKRRKEAQTRINHATSTANNLIRSGLSNQLSNIDTNNDKLAMSNYFDLGGSMIPTLSGAIGYDLTNKQLDIENVFALNSLSNNPKTNNYENGGNLFAMIPNTNGHGMILNNGLTEINSGGTHSENPFGGVFMGVDQNGTPNLVEEGEVKWNDYIFSNKLKLDDVGAHNNNLSESLIDKTFADIAKIFNEESSERTNDPISKATLNDALTRLAAAQEQEREVAKIEETNTFAFGGSMDNLLQAAPIIGSGLSVISDAFGLTNDRDYTHINNINTPSPTPLISPERIGNYMSYVPLDKNYYLNRQSAQTAATREAINNASNGNRGALMNALAAVDYGASLAEGQLARQAEEADLNQRMQIENFNRGTNMFNSQQELQAAAQNSDAYRYDSQIKANIEMAKAQMKEAVDLRSAAGRSANINNFLSNLAELGKERIAMNSIMSNPGLYYYWDKDGSIKYKNGFENLMPEQKEAITKYAEDNRPANSKSCGGHLNIKS
jgi:hypothetical protein